MAYKVIRRFTDLQDNCHAYKEGDVYPREGAVVSEVRIAQLVSEHNRQGTPLIIKETSLDSATTPAQPERVEQEAPSEDAEVKDEAVVKATKGRKKKED